MLRGKAALLRNMKTRPTIDGQLCAYSHRVCSQSRLDGYDFCLRHILEDKNSPFKQCSFLAPKTNRRCSNAAPKSDRKEGHCLEHAKKAAIMRQRGIRKRRPQETAETLLEELASSTSIAADAGVDNKRLRFPQDSVASKALEYASSSDSDAEAPLIDQAWRQDDDSEAESIDSEMEDPLKHAGVYSPEEVALLLRDKLIRLQSLYIEQFKRLQHVLKEKRRKYIHTHKQELETLGSIHIYKHDSTHHKKYKKLQAMKRYHNFYGKEALLHQKCNMRRVAVAEGIHYRPPTFPRCIAVTSDGRCIKRVVPLSKFCIQHILSDPHQVLFKSCSFHHNKCKQPVFSLEDKPLCRRHYTLTHLPSSTATTTQTDDDLDVGIKSDDMDNLEEGSTFPADTSSQNMVMKCKNEKDFPTSTSLEEEECMETTTSPANMTYALSSNTDRIDSSITCGNGDLSMNTEGDLLSLVECSLLGPVLNENDVL